jgi:hypothetical protein
MTREEHLDHLDHMINHSKFRQAGCQECIDGHNAAIERSNERAREHGFTSSCDGVGRIVTWGFERQAGGGAWAKTTCPDCGKRVPATRPTRALPWSIVGQHKPAARNPRQVDPITPDLDTRAQAHR